MRGFQCLLRGIYDWYMTLVGHQLCWISQNCLKVSKKLCQKISNSFDKYCIVPTWVLVLVWMSLNEALCESLRLIQTHSDSLSSCSSGIAFWVTQVGWQFISTLILGGNICFWAKNYIENVLEHHFWGKGHFSRSMRRIFLKLQRHSFWLIPWGA